MSLGVQAVRNAALNFARYVLVGASSLMISILLARLLSPARLGMYSYFNWLAAMGCMLATLGLPSACEKYTAEAIGAGTQDETGQLLRPLLRFMAAMTAGVVVAGTALLFEFQILAGVLPWVLALTVLTLSANIGLAAVLGGSQNYRDLATINGFGALLQLGLLSAAAMAGSSVTVLLAINLLVWLVIVVLLARKARPLLAIKIGTAAASPVFLRVRRFIVPASYIALLDFLVWDKSEIIFLKHYRSLEEIAFYSIAVTTVMKIAGVGGAFSGILLPVSSHAYGAAGFERLPRIMENSVKYLQMLLAPVAVLGIIITPAMIEFVYGSRYAPAAPAARILLICLPFFILGSVGSALLYTAERVRALALISSTALVLNCGLDLLLIPSRGVVGAAIANGVTQVAAGLAMLIYARRVTASKLPFAPVVRIYLAALIAACPAVILMYQHGGRLVLASAATIAYVITYTCGLLLLRAAGQPEITVLRAAWAGTPLDAGPHS